MPVRDTAMALNRASGLAVDLGGTKIAAARILDGAVVRRVQTATEGSAGVQAQIAAIVDLLNRLDLTPSDRVGVAVTGRVTRTGMWHALNTRTLTDVEEVPLRQMLSATLARSVTIHNDAAAAAVGEHVEGAGRGFRSSGFITVSTGVGGGFVLDGRPLQSDSGLAGHVGFTTATAARNRCGSGRLKTVESIASGAAIARYAAEAGHPSRDARAVFKAHLAGQPWASDLITQSADTVGELCANLKAMLDLDIISLGGSIGLAQGYLNLVRAAVDREPEIFRPRLVHAELGMDAALIGALAL